MIFDFNLGNNPTELGAVYAAYRALGYSDEDAAVLAQEEFLDRELTAEERAAFTAALRAAGGTIPLTAGDLGSAGADILSAGGAGFFGALSPAGWVAVVGGAAVLGGAVYLSWRR